jgi:type I restriction enzyme, S subunit
MIVTKTETLKEQYKNSLQELENLYGSLSQRAFKGELEFNKRQTA